MSTEPTIRLTEVTLDHPNAPISGRSVYIVVQEKNHKNKTVLLHPWTLTEFEIAIVDFQKGEGATYWPPEIANAPRGEVINVEKIAKIMQDRLEDYAERKKQHPAQLVRRLIAELRGVEVKEIPQYKEAKPVPKAFKERGPRRPGIIDAIKAELGKGFTIEEMVITLKGQFPDREADGMRNTVKCQLARLPKNEGKAITKTETKGRGLVFQWVGGK